MAPEARHVGAPPVSYRCRQADQGPAHGPAMGEEGGPGLAIAIGEGARKDVLQKFLARRASAAPGQQRRAARKVHPVGVNRRAESRIGPGEPNPGRSERRQRSLPPPPVLGRWTLTMSGSESTSRALFAPRPPSLVPVSRDGRAHLREGRFAKKPGCSARRETDDVVALAVADGHGTSARGDVGAELAVDVAVGATASVCDPAEPGSGRGSPRAVHAYAQHPLRIQLYATGQIVCRRHAGRRERDLHRREHAAFALASPTTSRWPDRPTGTSFSSIRAAGLAPDRSDQTTSPRRPRVFAERGLTAIRLLARHLDGGRCCC